MKRKVLVGFLFYRQQHPIDPLTPLAQCSKLQIHSHLGKSLFWRLGCHLKRQQTWSLPCVTVCCLPVFSRPFLYWNHCYYPETVIQGLSRALPSSPALGRSLVLGYKLLNWNVRVMLILQAPSPVIPLNPFQCKWYINVQSNTSFCILSQWMANVWHLASQVNVCEPSGKPANELMNHDWNQNLKLQVYWCSDTHQILYSPSQLRSLGDVIVCMHFVIAVSPLDCCKSFVLTCLILPLHLSFWVSSSDFPKVSFSLPSSTHMQSWGMVRHTTGGRASWHLDSLDIYYSPEVVEDIFHSSKYYCMNFYVTLFVHMPSSRVARWWWISLLGDFHLDAMPMIGWHPTSYFSICAGDTCWKSWRL